MLFCGKASLPSRRYVVQLLCIEEVPRGWEDSQYLTLAVETFPSLDQATNLEAEKVQNTRLAQSYMCTLQAQRAIKCCVSCFQSCIHS